MNALFVTEIKPFPVHGGEKLRSYGFLSLLSESFDKVVAIIGKTAGGIAEKPPFRNIDFHEFKFESLYTGSKFKDIQGIFKKDKALTQLFDRLLEENSFDVAFIDYQYYGQYIGYFKRKGLPVVYGTHNVQSKIAYQKPAISLRNWVSKMLYYSAYAFHEWYFFRKADALISVSEDDRRYYKKYMPDHKIFVIPNFLIESDYALQNTVKQDYVIMTANFEAFQNSMGLEWFLNNVWRNKVFETKKLMLVGIGSDHMLKDHHSDIQNIEALGRKDDLKPYIASARVSVVPLIHGSGTRLKCIESMALKTQIISTSKGAEGIEHEGSIVIADTPELFTELLIEILNGKIDRTDKGYQIYKNKYSSVPNLVVFKNIIHQITFAKR
jgi:hypothetical protein